MKRIAAYPGTFDPITNGHLDIIRRGANIFDELVVLVAERDEKHTLFTVGERVEMVKCVTKRFNNVSVLPLKGLLVSFLKANSIKFVLRGLRAVSDFDYELQLALTNRKLYPDLETVFIMSSNDYIFLSSSIVREIARFGGDISKFVPPCVEKILKGRMVSNGRRIRI